VCICTLFFSEHDTPLAQGEKRDKKRGKWTPDEVKKKI
jgi:hypothetical protein